MRHPNARIELSEEEAEALLGLCLTSPQKLTAVSEKALKKLAAFCSNGFVRNPSISNHTDQRELEKAG